MTERFLKSRRPMACALSVHDYLSYFLLKPSSNDAKDKSIQHGSLLAATVYQQERDGIENIIYSKCIRGNKSFEPLAMFVAELIGKSDNRCSNGSALRTANVIDLDDEEEYQLPPNSTVSINLMSSRSPTKVGAEQLLELFDHCKQNNIRVSTRFNFAHPFSWDNKYNKHGIKELHERGVKFKSLNFQQVVNAMVNDVQDNLESLHGLQTSRGTICIDYHMLKRAVAKFRDALLTSVDQYHQHNEERLKEIVGKPRNTSTSRRSTRVQLSSFSIATYRDYFFLQNSDQIWAKLRVTLHRIKNGLAKEELLFEKLYYNLEEATMNKRTKEKDTLNTKELNTLTEKLWDLMGNRITLEQIAAHDNIIVNLTMIISEYPDRMKWHATIQTLHRHLAETLQQAQLRKVRVESVVRYAINVTACAYIDDSSECSTPSTLSGQSSKVEADREVYAVPECMHIQDMLFDMLEDIEDSFVKMAEIEFDRGTDVRIERATLSSGMGLLNKAITVRTEDEQVHSMNSDFLDIYAESVNRV